VTKGNAQMTQQTEMTRQPRKVQLGLGLPPETLARTDRLRACTGLTRGQVIERALVGGGLHALERGLQGQLVRFDALAERAGMSWQEYARDYATRYSSKTYPPTVETLEQEAGIAAPAAPATSRATLRDVRSA